MTKKLNAELAANGFIVEEDQLLEDWELSTSEKITSKKKSPKKSPGGHSKVSKKYEYSNICLPIDNYINTNYYLSTSGNVTPRKVRSLQNMTMKKRNY